MTRYLQIGFTSTSSSLVLCRLDLRRVEILEELELSPDVDATPLEYGLFIVLLVPSFNAIKNRVFVQTHPLCHVLNYMKFTLPASIESTVSSASPFTLSTVFVSFNFRFVRGFILVHFNRQK